MCQNIRGTAGKNAKGHTARRESVDDFVDGPIAAAREHYVGAICHRSLGQFVRHVGTGGGRQFDFQSRLAQHIGGFVDFTLPPGRTPPRNRIINEGAFFQFWILDWQLLLESAFAGRRSGPAFNPKSKS